MRNASFYARRMGQLQAKLEILAIYLAQTTDPTLARLRDETQEMLDKMDQDDKVYLARHGLPTVEDSNAWLLRLDTERDEPVGLTK